MDCSIKCLGVLTHKVKVSEDEVIAGKGSIAIEPIATGEIVWQPNDGFPIVSNAERKLRDDKHEFSQVGLDLFAKVEPDGWCYNHSCVPNSALIGGNIVAMRNVALGEEVTYDYGLTETSNRWSFWCQCGHPECRLHISNQDYLNTELRNRQKDYVSAHAEYAAAQADRISVLKYYVRRWLYLLKLKLRGDGSSAMSLLK
ncbi:MULTISPECIES: SET domain-containing protein [unclassified Lentimonas]|uniref:SET domain-containing protein n=1 Tax=unclassified Lentimonas TaxID=2630993 RepID=UPI001321D7BD|nr:MULTISPECIES: SET domain-containing protein [unclassified Lentimonas]CAA6678609.1 Unannotated [Lentimonas sp. CC4]CAA6685841.1 Unannotated [Lentimonas sp. CC6]CAA7076315.1 Unannotated [Lentimonas sp. CC4]CAA7171862.1 Unannotated [Lentimonas sp. CC21]CAA7181569.1 Unannotated [Lentimonas sp. CC8]